MNFNLLDHAACFDFSKFQVAVVAENINTKGIDLNLQSIRQGSRGTGRYNPIPVSHPYFLCLRKSHVFVSLLLKSLLTGCIAFIDIEMLSW
jgi:hypothetical protein